MGQSQHLRVRERLAQKERERAGALGPRLLFEQAAGVLQGATQRLALGVRALAGLDLAMRAIQQRVNLAGACRGCREPVRIEVEIKAEERLLLSPRLREASECLLGEIVDRAHRHETYPD